MENFARPKVVLSKCINLEATRYDGGIIKDEFAKKLGEFVEYIPVCPEVQIGLPIPRDPIIIVKNEPDKLIQPKTKIDLTQKMHEFSRGFLKSLNEVDGFLLKSKSPSCGVKDTNYYKDYEGKEPVGKTSGMFARNVMEMFKNYPIEDEKRLIDRGIRELFLTKIFAFADMRTLKDNLTKSNLIEFHARYKLMLMTYNQTNLRVLGKIISNLKENEIDAYQNYSQIFKSSFNKKPSVGAHINTLLHAFGYFKDKLSPKEKAHFLDVIEDFSKGNIDLYTPIELILGFAIRFNEDYILKQKYFNPYPKELRRL
ncbi:YbgA family protein [Caldisericum exile]|uniref:YbgA family protein n=1 Tax=Caldisericum exile TaxID=693075 RepID=UPI003C796DD7